MVYGCIKGFASYKVSKALSWIMEYSHCDETHQCMQVKRGNSVSEAFLVSKTTTTSVLLRRSDWLERIEGLRGIAVSTHAQSGVSRQEDGVFWDAVVCVARFAPECFLQRCLVAVLPHRRN